MKNLCSLFNFSRKVSKGFDEKILLTVSFLKKSDQRFCKINKGFHEKPLVIANFFKKSDHRLRKVSKIYMVDKTLNG